MTSMRLNKMTVTEDAVIKTIRKDEVESVVGTPLPWTLRAWGLVYKGELVGIGGYYSSMSGHVVYTDLKPGVKLPKTLIYRVGKAFMNFVPRGAICTADNSEKFLKRLGWRDIGNGVFQWQEI